MGKHSLLSFYIPRIMGTRDHPMSSWDFGQGSPLFLFQFLLVISSLVSIKKIYLAGEVT